MRRSSNRLPTGTPEERLRRARASRGLVILLLAGLLWQTGRGGRRILGRAGAAEGTPAIAPVSVDLLRDPAWRLRLLPGIGTGRAWEIVRDRERAPPYRRLEDLRRVRGIGPRTIERIGGTSALRVLLDGRPVGWAHDTAARSPGDA